MDWDCETSKSTKDSAPLTESYFYVLMLFIGLQRNWVANKEFELYYNIR